MSKPNPELLRRFYGRMLGRKVSEDDLYEDVSFETYFRLMQIEYPLISRHTAATNSRLEKYKKLASDFPDEDTRKKGVAYETQSLKGKALDLGTATIAATVERVSLSRVKGATRWPTLARLEKLRVISALLCNTSAIEVIEPAIALEELEVRSCNLETVKTLLNGTRCRRVRIEHSASPVLDLAPLSRHTELVELRAGAPLVRNLDAVCGKALAVLSVGSVAVSDGLERCLDSVAPTLTFLALSTSEPFSPESMPAKLPHLERMHLTVHASEEDAWLDYAARRPDVAFQFTCQANVATGGLSAAIEDEYRDIDILKVTKGKKVYFEISGDWAATFGFDDNGDLEDAARPLAKAAKRRIQWSSEHDTFVAMAKSADDLRWLIDALNGLNGS